MDFSAVTLLIRRNWDVIFKVLKKKKSDMNTLLAKLSFKNEEERDFTRETRAKIIHHTRPDSQEMLKGILKTVMKGGKLVT